MGLQTVIPEHSYFPLFNGKPVNRFMRIDFALGQHDRRKCRLMRGVWKFLGLQAKTGIATVTQGFFIRVTDIQMVAGVELYAGLVGEYFHETAADRIIDADRRSIFMQAVLFQHPVLIVTARQEKLVIRTVYPAANALRR